MERFKVEIRRQGINSFHPKCVPACICVCVHVCTCVPREIGSKGQWGMVALGNKESKRGSEG